MAAQLELNNKYSMFPSERMVFHSLQLSSKPPMLARDPRLPKHRRQIIASSSLTTMRYIMFPLLVILLGNTSLCIPIGIHLRENNIRILARERINARNSICQSSGHCVLSRSDQKSGRSEVSISPNLESPSPPSINSTQLSNKPESAVERGLTPWIPTTETVLTAVFRAAMMALTMINVNVSWKLHGTYQDLR